MKKFLFATWALCAIDTAQADNPTLIAVVSGAFSSENITHLAPGPSGGTSPGGANAARWLDVTASVFLGDGNTPAGAGERVTFAAFDSAGGTSRRTKLTSVVAYTNARGVATARLPIGECRGPGIVGPVTVHRGYSRPEYWDITYVPGAQIQAQVNGDATPRPATFQHVCKERYRGTRP